MHHERCGAAVMQSEASSANADCHPIHSASGSQDDAAAERRGVPHLDLAGGTRGGSVAIFKLKARQEVVGPAIRQR